MIIIRHRINTIRELKQIPRNHGVEIDIRACGGKLWLDHDPIAVVRNHDELAAYLQHFEHALIVFNIKEAGLEQQTIDLASQYGIDNYFLLDVTAPYLYLAPRQQQFRKIAVRYSEMEPIEAVEVQLCNVQPLVDWVWIDTFTDLPLRSEVVPVLRQFRTCLVCPDNWGRPQDIPDYVDRMRNLNFAPDAVMTSTPYVELWEASVDSVG